MSTSTSDTNTMQDASSSRGKISKFVEGRLKLSTSCTECHRRKQKCDQQQPCRHCARRYPSPKCIYPSAKETTPPTVIQATASSSKAEAQLIRPPLSRVDTNRSSSSKPSLSPQDFGTENFVILEGQKQDDKPISSVGMLGPESLDDWGPSEYQDLLTTMVGSITEEYQDVGISARRKSKSPISATSRQASNERALIPYQRGSVGRPSNFSITSVDPLHFLGITPTYQSGELLQAFLKVITKYVVSIDGSPKPNYYNDIWVPWCMKSPLLVYLGIFTASCYQSEAQKIPPAASAAVIGYKLKSIGLLNAMLRNKQTATCPEAITAVTYLVTSEWYWSNLENVQAHMRGLKEMVRLRGGLGDLGHSGFLRKMVLLVDYQISISYNLDLNFPHNITSHVRYPASMSTPLLYSHVPFSTISTTIEISPETATILDDIRFLITAILRLLDLPLHTDDEIVKLTTTSTWIQTRILAMPDGSDKNTPLSTDTIYKSVRIAALIYCRAIVARQPLAKICTLTDLNLLWAQMWRVTLTRWKQIPGIFIWVILAGNEAAQETPHGRFLKSMFKAATSYVALEHFEVVDAALMGFVKMQRWLRGEVALGVVGGSGGEMERPMAFLHNYKR